jgi:hypothetical protein
LPSSMSFASSLHHLVLPGGEVLADHVEAKLLKLVHHRVTDSGGVHHDRDPVAPFLSSAGRPDDPAALAGPGDILEAVEVAVLARRAFAP